jgi:hypothetical protein
MRGLEPPRLAAHGPKPCASANSATSALHQYNSDFFDFVHLRAAPVAAVCEGRTALTVENLGGTISSMSNLTLAKKFHKDSGRSIGRKFEGQFNDLRKAVERIIVHLEKLEKASQSKG